MRRNNSAGLFNTLTYILLVATSCVLLSYAVIGFDVYNPFPYPTPLSVAALATLSNATLTPTAIATWTPTPTPTITPIPSPTNTRTPTPTTSATPTFPPTATPTPRATRAPWPFTCEIEYRSPEYGMWSGVAGYVQDLDGNPLPGYYVKLEGPVPNLPARRAGEDPRINAVYGNDAAWEQGYNPAAYQAMEIRVQLFNDHADADGEYRAVSEQVIVKLGGYASSSLGFIICTLNWENWP